MDNSSEKTYSVKELRLTVPNAYRSWTDKDDLELTQLYTSDKKIPELANKFQRKPGAIRSRLKKLGLLN